MMGAVPPHDLDAEAAVVSAALLDPEAREQAMPIVRAEDFYDPELRQVWAAIGDLASRCEPVDFVTVNQWLRTSGMSEQAGGARRLAQLVDATPHVIHVAAHARIVARKAHRRAIIRALHELASAGYGTDHADEDYAGHVERVVMGLARGDTRGPRQLGEHIGDAMRDVREYLETGVTPAVPWPLADLTERTGGGMRPGELWTIAARPGQGKTALADQCAIAAAMPGDGIRGWVLSSSLEMVGSSKALRMVAGQAGRSVSALRVGYQGHHDAQQAWQDTQRAAKELAELPIWIDDEPSTPERIASEARKLARQAERAGARLALVVVDYLQILDLPASDRRDLAIGHATMLFQRLAKELRVPVLQLAQLNRDVDRRAVPRPVLSDLRESGTIEQDSDGVIFVYRPGYYDHAADQGEAELIIGKQRNGPTGVVRARWCGEQTRFTDLYETGWR